MDENEHMYCDSIMCNFFKLAMMSVCVQVLYVSDWDRIVFGPAVLYMIVGMWLTKKLPHITLKRTLDPILHTIEFILSTALLFLFFYALINYRTAMPLQYWLIIANLLQIEMSYIYIKYKQTAEESCIYFLFETIMTMIMTSIFENKIEYPVYLIFVWRLMTFVCFLLIKLQFSCSSYRRIRRIAQDKYVNWLIKNSGHIKKQESLFANVYLFSFLFANWMIPFEALCPDLIDMEFGQSLVLWTSHLLLMFYGIMDVIILLLGLDPEESY